MNRVIGFTFFLLLLAAIAFTSLKGMRPISESSAITETTSVDWRLILLAGEKLTEDAGLMLRLEDNGKLTGNGGCNSFFADYTLRDSEFKIGPIGATRMACPEPQMHLEVRFLDALSRATRIEIRASRLILADASADVLAVFAANAASVAN